MVLCLKLKLQCILLLSVSGNSTTLPEMLSSLDDIKLQTNKVFPKTSKSLEETLEATLDSMNASIAVSFLNNAKISNTSKTSNSVDDERLNLTTNKRSSEILSSTEDVQISMAPSKSPKIGKKSESSSDYGNDYEDGDEGELVYENDSGGSVRNITRQRHIYIMKRMGITYAWGRWGKWSRCTNSCVQIRKRQCIKRVQNSTDPVAVETTFYPDLSEKTTGCLGNMKKYRLCKDEKCIKSTNSQMRNEQCSAYNRVLYKGKFYNWLGYEKEHNECELYCKPIDSDIFMSMNQSVTDGTPCGKPAIFYTHYYRRKAVCVEGICKAVHSSGAIRPATTKDSQDKCGSVLCQKVSEIFSQSKLNHGYHYITTIPAGAMNMTISQLAKSKNLIALRTTDNIFILNGNSLIASEGGIYLYDDDTYDYNKEASLIVAKGPLHKPVKLMLSVHGYNPGVSYTYILPVSSASISEPEELQSQWNELGQPLDEIDDKLKKKRRRFSWELLGFGQCNRSCGPGIQLPIFRCIRDSAVKESFAKYYSPKRCASIEKPQFSEDIYHCNRGLCPAYWRPSDYGDCECGESLVLHGVKSRQVKCVQEQATGLTEVVEEAMCIKAKLPDLKESCNCHLVAKRKIYARNPDNPPKMYSKLIAANSLLGKRHYNTTVAPPLRRFHRDDRNDKAGVWLMSDWNPQCSSDCNANFEHRTIYCDRTAPYTDLCDARVQPEQKRVCKSQRSETCRKGNWFTSEWSNCTGECFKLQRTRIVLCIQDGYVVDAHQCDEKSRPLDVSNCTQRDAGFCGPKWHYSEWSECSRTCGEGVQRRYAKCLEFDWKQNAMIESNKCKYVEREPVYGACTVAKCEELKTNHSTIAAAAAAAASDEDLEQLLNDQNVNGVDGGDAVVDKYKNIRDLVAGKEKLVIAAAPKRLQNCNDELNNCKRINRERLCKLEFYKKYCCLACHDYN